MWWEEEKEHEEEKQRREGESGQEEGRKTRKTKQNYKTINRSFQLVLYGKDLYTVYMKSEKQENVKSSHQ